MLAAMPPTLASIHPRFPAAGLAACGLGSNGCAVPRAARTRSRRQRQLSKPNAGGIEDGVDDRGSAGHRGRFPGTPRLLVLPRHHQHIDVGDVLKCQGRVASPFRIFHRRLGERYLLLQHPAGRLDHIAVDLMPDAIRVDHHARILADGDASNGDLARPRIDRNICDPGRPCGRRSRKLAVIIERIGETAAIKQITFTAHRFRHGARRPAGSLGDRMDEIHGARILQIAQPVFDWVHLGRKRELVDIALMGKAVGHGRDAAKPRCAGNRRHVVDGHPHIAEGIGRNGGAVAHIERHRRVRQFARQDERERGSKV